MGIGHTARHAGDINLHAKALTEPSIGLNRLLDNRPGVDPAQTERQAPRFELFGVEDVADEPNQTNAISMRDSE